MTVFGVAQMEAKEEDRRRIQLVCNLYDQHAL